MPLTDEDKAEVQEQFVELLNGEAFTETLSGAINGVVATAINGLKVEDTVTSVVTKAFEERDKAAAEAKAKREAEEAARKPSSDDAQVEASPAFRRLQTQFEEMERKAQDAEKARLAAEEKAQADRLYSGGRDALLAAGADSSAIAHAMAFLKDQRRLAFNDDGEAGIRFKRDWGEEIVTGKKGADEWLKTEDGKRYLPATNTQGTGDGAGRSPRSRGATSTAESVLGLTSRG